MHESPSPNLRSGRPAEDLIALLGTSKPRETSTWIKGSLQREAASVRYAPGHETPIESIVNLYRQIGDDRLRRRITRSVASLFKELDWITPDLRYAADLLVLASLLHVDSIRGEVLRIANSGTAKGLIVPGASTDLHHFFIAAIVSMGPAPSCLRLFQRDVYDASYAALCYQGLWELDLGNASKYLPVIAAHAREESYSHDLALCLDSFLRSAPLDYVASEFLPKALGLIDPSPDLTQLFHRAVRRAGFRLHLPDQWFFVEDEVNASRSNDFPQHLLPTSYFYVYELESHIEQPFGGQGRGQSVKDVVLGML